jgi:hypothetical protein
LNTPNKDRETLWEIWDILGMWDEDEPWSSDEIDEIGDVMREWKGDNEPTPPTYRRREDEEYPDTDTPEQPEPEDYYMWDSGPLGSMTSVGVVGGDFIGQYHDFDNALTAIRLQMDKDQFWPAVWYRDDHGGLTHVDPQPKDD